MKHSEQGKEYLLPNEPPKLVATGKKETVNGIETEIYTADAPAGKDTYWIALHYPEAQRILQWASTVTPMQWSTIRPLLNFSGAPGSTCENVKQPQGLSNNRHPDGG
jgi:hypothetical protein